MGIKAKGLEIILCIRKMLNLINGNVLSYTGKVN